MQKSNKLSLKVSVRIKPSSDGQVSTRESNPGYVSVDDQSFGKYTSVISSACNQDGTFGAMMQPLV